MSSLEVFVSFTRHDGAFAVRLVADLRAKGIEAAFEPRDGTTAPRDEREAESPRQAQVVLVVVSAASLAALHSLEEVERCAAAKRRVIALLATSLDQPLPPCLAHAAYVDFSADHPLALERLCALLASPSTRITPPHAYYAYGSAPSAGAWSTFPDSASPDRGARAHTPYPYVSSQRYGQASPGHSLNPVNATPAVPSRGRSGVVVATACLAVAGSVVVFAALVGGSTKTQRMGVGAPLPEPGARASAGAATHVRASEDWLGSWRSACSPSPYGATTWTTLSVETTRLVAEVSECVADPPFVLRFEWQLDATRSRGDGLHELDMRFDRLQVLPRRTAQDWNAANRFGRHDWADGRAVSVPPAVVNPGLALKPGDARHELAALRANTLSLPAALSSGLTEPTGSRPRRATANERFTRLAR